jgi:hypothetical protein
MSDNPLLSKIRLPGRIFQLPSRGLFYKNGELDDSVKEGELHIHPMSALAEINMKNPDQLFSGQAVEMVFKDCVPGVKKPNQLLSKDVDAIIMFLRTVTYGPNYEFTARHNCEHGKEHSYIADVDTMINRIKFVDPTTIDSLFTFEMPNKQIVRLRPSLYEQVVQLLKKNEGKNYIGIEEMKNNLMLMVCSVITQVDDVTDEGMIREWFSQIPATWVSKLADRIESANDWGPSMNWTTKCSDCGEEFEIELPINPVSFFTE